MFVMHGGQQRLSKDVGHVIVRSNLAYLDAPVRDVLPHLQVAPIDVPRTLARAPLIGELDSARVVHVHGRRVRLLPPHLGELSPEIDHLSSSVRCGYNFSFSG
eukprot:3460347-Pleurochrysis_carterae.AAC.1